VVGIDFASAAIEEAKRRYSPLVPRAMTEMMGDGTSQSWGISVTNTEVLSKKNGNVTSTAADFR